MYSRFDKKIRVVFVFVWSEIYSGTWRYNKECYTTISGGESWGKETYVNGEVMDGTRRQKYNSSQYSKIETIFFAFNYKRW